jgi:glutamate synthase (NADPH) large chain
VPAAPFDGTPHGPRRPRAQGLYDPANEHDACGVGMVADLSGRPGHGIVRQALTVLRNLDHRGAKGAEPDDGDGAGILTQIPDAFLRDAVDFALPPRGAYAVGNAFLPADEAERTAAIARIESIARDEDLTVLGWRDLPHRPDRCGPSAREVMPYFAQLFVAGRTGGATGIDLDRMAFCLRERAEQAASVYFPSLSGRTIVYKGMLTTRQLEAFFPDLLDPRFHSAIALVHSRFSTNTFPSWELAHP